MGFPLLGTSPKMKGSLLSYAATYILSRDIPWNGNICGRRVRRGRRGDPRSQFRRKQEMTANRYRDAVERIPRGGLNPDFWAGAPHVLTAAQVIQ